MKYPPQNIYYNNNSLLYSKYTNFYYVGKKLVTKIELFFTKLIVKTEETLETVLELLRLIIVKGPNSPPRYTTF